MKHCALSLVGEPIMYPVCCLQALRVAPQASSWFLPDLCLVPRPFPLRPPLMMDSIDYQLLASLPSAPSCLQPSSALFPHCVWQYINEFIKMLHDREISSFLVTNAQV